MEKRVGRPMKYDTVLEKLDVNELYTPSKIAALADELGLLRGRSDKERKMERQRIRIAMGRYSNNHCFPDEGDGMVKIKGQAPVPGWFGWRWKEPM